MENPHFDRSMNLDISDGIRLTSTIVIAYVTHNSIPAHELPNLIRSVNAAVAASASKKSNEAYAPTPQSSRPTQADIRRSMTPDALISFIDGRRYKVLKRHLTSHGFDPSSYRQRFGLPADYPMVAVNYAARRIDIARASGLGRPRAVAEQPPWEEREIS